MEKSIYIGKVKEDLLNLALYELNVNKSDIIVKEKEIKTGIFKTKKIELTIIKKKDIEENLINIIKNIIKDMSIEITNIVIKYLKINSLDEFKFIIDVSNYRKHKEKKLMFLAKNLAKEVLKNGIEVNLDPINSYERRIVHNTLSNFKDIITESSGEEPNRYVVIKKRES